MSKVWRAVVRYLIAAPKGAVSKRGSQMTRVKPRRASERSTSAEPAKQ
jgi:hypothetical protein